MAESVRKLIKARKMDKNQYIQYDQLSPVLCNTKFYSSVERVCVTLTRMEESDDDL